MSIRHNAALESTLEPLGDKKGMMVPLWGTQSKGEDESRGCPQGAVCTRAHGQVCHRNDSQLGSWRKRRHVSARQVQKKGVQGCGRASKVAAFRVGIPCEH